MLKNLKIYSLVIVLITMSLSTFTQDSSAIKSITPCKVTNWSFQTGGPVYATPTINNNVIYTGSMDSIFYAIDAKTGQELWSFKTAGIITCNALVADNKIIFESGNILYAINKNGETIWQFKLSENMNPSMVDPWDFHRSSPVEYKNIVYVGAEDGLVYGVDIKTGKETFKVQTSSKNLVRTTPVIYSGNIYIGDWEGVMYAYSLENGNLVWEYDTKNDYTFQWKNSILSTPTIHDGAIYFSGRNCCLYALDIKTGDKKWVYKNSEDGWILGSPVVENNAVYIGSSDHHQLHSFNVKTGDLIWKTKLDCRIWGTVNIEDDNLFIGSNGFYKIDKTNGNIKARVDFEKIHEDVKYGEYLDQTANFHSSPVSYHDNFIIGSDNGNIYSISLF